MLDLYRRVHVFITLGFHQRQQGSSTGVVKHYLSRTKHYHPVYKNILISAEKVRKNSAGTWLPHGQELQSTMLTRLFQINPFSATRREKRHQNKVNPLNIQPVIIVRELKRQQTAASTNFVGCFLLVLFYFFFLSLFFWRWITLLVPALGLWPK